MSSNQLSCHFSFTVNNKFYVHTTVNITDIHASHLTIGYVARFHIYLTEAKVAGCIKIMNANRPQLQLLQSTNQQQLSFTFCLKYEMVTIDIVQVHTHKHTCTCKNTHRNEREREREI